MKVFGILISVAFAALLVYFVWAVWPSRTETIAVRGFGTIIQGQPTLTIVLPPDPPKAGECFQFDGRELHRVACFCAGTGGVAR